MADYPTNSNKSKTGEENNSERRVDPIVDAPMKTRKRNCLKRAMGELVKEDIPKAFKERIVPTLKDTAYSIIIDTVAAALHVDNNRVRGGSVGRVSYRDYGSYQNKPQNNQKFSQPGYDFDDILFDDRGTADAVLEELIGVLNHYGMVRVADLYNLCRVSCRYTDNAYGWTDLRGARPVPVNDGWIIDFPKAIPLK